MISETIKGRNPEKCVNIDCLKGYPREWYCEDCGHLNLIMFEHGKGMLVIGERYHVNCQLCGNKPKGGRA